MIASLRAVCLTDREGTRPLNTFADAFDACEWADGEENENEENEGTLWTTERLRKR